MRRVGIPCPADGMELSNEQTNTIAWTCRIIFYSKHLSEFVFRFTAVARSRYEGSLIQHSGMCYTSDSEASFRYFLLTAENTNVLGDNCHTPRLNSICAVSWLLGESVSVCVRTASRIEFTPIIINYRRMIGCALLCAATYAWICWP